MNAFALEKGSLSAYQMICFIDLKVYIDGVISVVMYGSVDTWRPQFDRRNRYPSN